MSLLKLSGLFYKATDVFEAACHMPGCTAQYSQVIIKEMVDYILVRQE
jgi:hypothetical protein